mmetsp:Transcript_23463/g.55945  ORF Transcript_23463/g.55945 Transcript_23463/m.55945 type:complete len:217 (-) Transcript_23463:703-1353(-)
MMSGSPSILSSISNTSGVSMHVSTSCPSGSSALSITTWLTGLSSTLSTRTQRSLPSCSLLSSMFFHASTVACSSASHARFPGTGSCSVRASTLDTSFRSMWLMGSPGFRSCAALDTRSSRFANCANGRNCAGWSAAGCVRATACGRPGAFHPGFSARSEKKQTSFSPVSLPGYRRAKHSELIPICPSSASPASFAASVTGSPKKASWSCATPTKPS